MAAWDLNSSAPEALTREQAIVKIKALALAQGYTAGFKVTHKGVEIETPVQLPADGIVMSDIKVASKLNNAGWAL